MVSGLALMAAAALLFAFPEESYHLALAIVFLVLGLMVLLISERK